MADSFVIESIHRTTVSNMKIAVCSHKMLLRLFPLIAPRQFLKKYVEKNFSKRKSWWNGLGSKQSWGKQPTKQLVYGCTDLAYDHRNFVDWMRVRLVCGRSPHSWVRSSRPAKHTFVDLAMKTFPRPFSPFRWFKKGSCQLLTKECALSSGKLPRRLANSKQQCGYMGKLTTLEMTWIVFKGRKHQLNNNSNNKTNKMTYAQRRKLGYMVTFWAHSEDSNQTWRIPSPSPMGAGLKNEVYRAIFFFFFFFFFFRVSARCQFLHTDVAF